MYHHLAKFGGYRYCSGRDIILKISMWTYNLMVNNIIRSKCIFVENNNIEILFSNYIFGLTFQIPSSK